MSDNTLSPITGIYNVISVTHTISSSFVTTLKVKRFSLGTANMVASAQGISMSNINGYTPSSYEKTSNVKSAYKVDFGVMYPDFTHLTDTRVS